jgi:VWFA-related protein
MKSATMVLACFAASSAVLAQAPVVRQPPPEPAPTITVNSMLVLVPALVRTKAGRLVYTLNAGDFRLVDDGVEQTLRLEQDAADRPLALVIVAQTGGAGADHLVQYQGLGALLDAMVGAVPHEIAVVGFDGAPAVAQSFTPNLDQAAAALSELEPGDNHAAILDAVTFAVGMLRKQPTTYRRAILLLSETIDQGSETSLPEVLRAVSDTNTAVYSMAFGSSKAAVKQEAAKLGWQGGPPTAPGPEHGCFAHDPDAEAKGESRATQNYDCVAELLPPLRFAKMAMLAAQGMLTTNSAEAVSMLTGGESFRFKDAKSLQHDLFTLSNQIPNHYVLTYRPQAPHAGFHAISLTLPLYPEFSIQARSSYWVDEATVGR